MKICHYCQAQNSDDRFFCVDCDARLGEALSEDLEQTVIQQTAATTEKLYNRSDPLHRTVYDTVMGFTALVGLAAFAVVGILLVVRGQGDAAYWIAPFLLILAALEALIPTLTWELEKIRLSFTFSNADDVVPGAGYRIGRLLSETTLTALGLAVVVLMAAQLF